MVEITHSEWTKMKIYLVVYLKNVFIELKRRGYDVFYHADKKECDFVVREGMRIKEAYQVNLPLLGMR